MANLEFAVIDVETTGLFPGGHDRVVEVAVLRLGSDGTQTQEFATLVNPGRDVGPTHIHGIRAHDIKDAPRFQDVAGDILDVIAGSVLVGHNIAFDLRFLSAEFARLAISFPDSARLCTLALSRKVTPTLPSRKLEELCRHWGIALPCAHSALDDARATAALLCECSRRLCGTPYPKLDRLPVTESVLPRQRWPTLAKSGKRHTRTQAAEEHIEQRSYLGELVRRLPVSATVGPEADEYMILIDRVLEDRRVTQEESDQLASLAKEIGLTRQDVMSVHWRYLVDLVCAALEDGIITPPEQEDLDDVRRLLDWSEDDYAMALAEATSLMEDRTASTTVPSHGDNELAGKTVCFTGALQCHIRGTRATREIAHAVAEEAGLIVRKGVTTDLDFLVAADPDSLSGKAQKAHRYGVRVIAEPVFWRLVGIDPA